MTVRIVRDRVAVDDVVAVGAIELGGEVGVVEVDARVEHRDLHRRPG